YSPTILIYTLSLHDALPISHVALNFFWHQLEKQIRIEGKVEKVDARISDEYFSSRPRESQLGAWASKQSKTLRSRDELIMEYERSEEHTSELQSQSNLLCRL